MSLLENLEPNDKNISKLFIPLIYKNRYYYEINE